jgi:hypothetical protein
MFAGGAYSRYSALENPYIIVRETTDAPSKSQVLADIKRQQKKIHQELLKFVMLNNHPCFKPTPFVGLLKYPEYPLFIIVKNNSVMGLFWLSINLPKSMSLFGVKV